MSAISIDTVFGFLRKIAESAFENLALIVAPLAPAVLFGLSAREFFEPLYGHQTAVFLMWLLSAALEICGFWAFKAFSQTGSWAPPLAYVLTGSLFTALIEWGQWVRMSFGILFFIVVAIVYHSIHIYNGYTKIREINAREKEKDSDLDREIKRDRELKKNARKYGLDSQKSTSESEVKNGLIKPLDIVKNRVENGYNFESIVEVDEVVLTIIKTIVKTTKNNQKLTASLLAKAAGMSPAGMSKRLDKMAKDAS